MVTVLQPCSVGTILPTTTTVVAAAAAAANVIDSRPSFSAVCTPATMSKERKSAVAPPVTWVYPTSEWMG